MASGVCALRISMLEHQAPNAGGYQWDKISYNIEKGS